MSVVAPDGPLLVKLKFLSKVNIILAYLVGSNGRSPDAGGASFLIIREAWWIVTLGLSEATLLGGSSISMVSGPLAESMCSKISTMSGSPAETSSTDSGPFAGPAGSHSGRLGGGSLQMLMVSAKRLADSLDAALASISRPNCSVSRVADRLVRSNWLSVAFSALISSIALSWY